MTRQLAAIMFTDIAGYTSLTQADEGKALALLQEQERLVRPVLVAHRGRKVKAIGDGLLAEFSNALDAVECGVDLQERIHEHNASFGTNRLPMRIGIHLGDVQRQGADILGDAVNIASRIEPLAEPGGLCLSDSVYDQVHNKVAQRIDTLGPKRLKGVRDAVEVFRVVFPWSSPGPAAGGPLLPRIAVLPLTNISPDPSDDYFAEGLTEELISVLSKIKGLRVISHTSVNQYKRTTKPLAQVGSELGADTVLEGSVRKAGDELRISVQLIDARTDEHRWSETYDRKLENVFAIQADVAERTAGALTVELLGPEQERIRGRPTASLAAYESYLKGIQATRPGTRSMVEADQEAVRCFESAIREDPDFAAAYAQLAMHLVLMAGETRPARETYARAREFASKALELDPESSDAHAAVGFVRMQADLDWSGAEAEFQQAIVLNPSSSTARTYYSFLLWTLQRFAEAEKQALTAIELDPLWVSPRECLIDAYEKSGDLKSAVEAAERMAKVLEDNRRARGVLALEYAYAGRLDAAERLVAPLAGAPSRDGRQHRAWILGFIGKPDELRALMNDAEAGRITDHFGPQHRAACYALLDEKEKALTELEKAPKESLWNAYQERCYDGIRDDPRFVALLQTANLPTTLSRPWKGFPGRPPP